MGKFLWPLCCSRAISGGGIEFYLSPSIYPSFSALSFFNNNNDDNNNTSFPFSLSQQHLCRWPHRLGFFRLPWTS